MIHDLQTFAGVVGAVGKGVCFELSRTDRTRLRIVLIDCLNA